MARNCKKFKEIVKHLRSGRERWDYRIEYNGILLQPRMKIYSKKFRKRSPYWISFTFRFYRYVLVVSRALLSNAIYVNKCIVDANLHLR